jgi:hypothetical protein
MPNLRNCVPPQSPADSNEQQHSTTLITARVRSRPATV